MSATTYGSVEPMLNTNGLFSPTALSVDRNYDILGYLDNGYGHRHCSD